MPEMKSHQPDLLSASRRLAGELSLDVSYFSDPAVPHYDPISVAESVALVLVGAFLEGVRQAVKDKGTALGRSFVDFLAARVQLLWNTGPGNSLPSKATVEAPPKLREELAPEVSMAIALVEHLTAEYLASLGMSERRAATLAAAIRFEAELLLMP